MERLKFFLASGLHKYEYPKMKADPKVPVSIVGVSGYAGLELARILLKHPRAHLDAVFANHAGFQLSQALPELAAKTVASLPMTQLDSVLAPGKTVFLATPAEVSMSLLPKLIEAGVDVIDLSGAFRLSKTEAKQWYGLGEELEEIRNLAEYGLVPWAGPALGLGKSGKGRLVANPGCYATSVLMAILPLLKEGVILPDSLVIDAKSGATGAGKKATQNLLFCEVEGECLPYKIGEHQHFPEICEYADRFASASIRPFFTTHLLGVRRGIISGIYARTRGEQTLETIRACYDEAYADYPLVRYGHVESSNRNSLSLKQVVGSARTEIRFFLKEDQLYVFSLIDNLMKGAASQAVENFNRLNDCPLAEGLEGWEGSL